MKLPVIIAGVTGIAASFAIPLPRTAAPPGTAPKPATASAMRQTHPAVPPPEKDWPLDVASIATLSANDCGAALDHLLRHYACALPDGDTFDLAVALTLRMTDLSAALNLERHPLKDRRLPAWLLQGVTESYLQRSALPPPAWMKAVAQSSAGRDAIAGLTARLAAASPDKAKAFAAACPERWQQTLNRKIREGLAERDPVGAARDAWEAAAPVYLDPAIPALLKVHYRDTQDAKQDDRIVTLTISARKAPVKETVAALALYGDGGADDSEQRKLLAILLKRDAAATRAAVEATGDPALRAHLQVAEHLPAPDSQNPDGTPRSALLQTSTDEIARYAVTEKGSVPFSLAAQGLTDPAQAFQWAKTHDPGQLSPLFGSWVQTDGPAAVQAALSLPPDDRLRQAVESGVSRANKVKEGDPWAWRATHEKPDAAYLQETPFFPGDSRYFGETADPEILAAAKYVTLPDPPPPHPSPPPTPQPPVPPVPAAAAAKPAPASESSLWPSVTPSPGRAPMESKAASPLWNPRFQ